MHLRNMHFYYFLGIKPMTLALQVLCSTVWTTGMHLIVFYAFTIDTCYLHAVQSKDVVHQASAWPCQTHVLISPHRSPMSRHTRPPSARTSSRDADGALQLFHPTASRANGGECTSTGEKKSATVCVERSRCRDRCEMQSSSYKPPPRFIL